MLIQISDFINNHLLGSAGAIGAILEMAIRMYPSEKPLSIAYAIAGAVHQIAAIFGALGNFLDKILPQKIK